MIPGGERLQQLRPCPECLLPVQRAVMLRRLSPAGTLSAAALGYDEHAIAVDPVAIDPDRGDVLLHAGDFVSLTLGVCWVLLPSTDSAAQPMAARGRQAHAHRPHVCSHVPATWAAAMTVFDDCEDDLP